MGQFSAIPVYQIITLFLAPFLEEMGWHGYALQRLQLRWSALVSSQILGSVWAMWHLPLFFIKSTRQYGLGVGSMAFWTYLLSVIPLTIFFTWIFNNTNRSTPRRSAFCCPAACAGSCLAGRSLTSEAGIGSLSMA